MGFITAVRTGLSDMFALPHAPSRQLTHTGNEWKPMGGKPVRDNDTYESVFPYANAIAQRFSTIIPYAVGEDGRRIDPAPTALQALYAPNDMFSCLEFLKFIAVNMLTQSHLDILVWTTSGPGGKITPDNITGYTFLPANSRDYNDDRSDWTYKVQIDGEPYRFTRQETISLTYSLHPNDPTRGIAPAMTIKTWASVDAMIADYEKGFFGNGAVPAGMLGIVSEDAQDFQTNRNRLEDAFRGAGKNNGVVYNMIPVDPLTHKPSTTSKLVWVPFQQSNNTLDLATVNEVVNNRMSNALAVPDIIRGIDNGQTYANAEQAERAFIENTLKPLCMTVWDKWQFELDRITGGLGYGITFDLALPSQTDVERAQAETKQINANTLIALVNAGASVDMAAQALGLGDMWRKLTLAPTAATPQPTLEPTVEPTPTLEPPSFARNNKAHETALQQRITPACKDFANRVIRLCRRSSNSLDDDINDIVARWVKDVETDLTAELVSYAKRTGRDIEDVLTRYAELHPETGIGVTITGVTATQWQQLYDWSRLPATYADAYHDHLLSIGRDSASTITKDTLAMLQRAEAEQWTAAELRENLRKHVTDRHAELLARCETVQSQRLGSYYSALNLSENLGVKLRKTWKTSDDDKVCDFCAHMDGLTLPLDETYMGEGTQIQIGDCTYVNTFESMRTPNGHPNCRCYELYTVDEAAENDD